tara:strand:+ start:1522 stop:1935 length:414 start_codon:yes stop_codon:yes gene_type:complete
MARRRTRKRYGGQSFHQCVKKCREDAKQNVKLAKEGQKLLKQATGKPVGKATSLIDRYKTNAAKQKTIAHKGMDDAKAAIKLGHEATKGSSALSTGWGKSASGGRKRRRTKRRRRSRSRSRGRKSRRRRRKSRRRRR